LKVVIKLIKKPRRPGRHAAFLSQLDRHGFTIPEEVNYNVIRGNSAVLNASKPYAIYHVITMSLNDDLRASARYTAKKAAHPGLPGRMQVSFRVLDDEERTGLGEQARDYDGQGIRYAESHVGRTYAIGEPARFSVADYADCQAGGPGGRYLKRADDVTCPFLNLGADRDHAVLLGARVPEAFGNLIILMLRQHLGQELSLLADADVRDITGGDGEHVSGAKALGGEVREV
jgi:hypothetical protein